MHVHVAAKKRPRSILTDGQWRSIADALHVSSREFDVLQGIFDGDKELAIAMALGISPHTVHAYIRRIYTKLDVHGHSELILRIFETYLSLEAKPPVTAASRHTA
jgi:DNA-binding NarL/FixJ family response regulator